MQISTVILPNATKDGKRGDRVEEKVGRSRREGRHKEKEHMEVQRTRW